MTDPNLSNQNSRVTAGSLLSTDAAGQMIKTNRFESMKEDIIQEQIEKAVANDNASDNHYLSPAARRAKIELEIRRTLESQESTKLITTAISVLRNEGQQYLNKEANTTLQNDLYLLNNQFLSLDIKNLNDEGLVNALRISPQSRQAIRSIAIEKLEQGLLGDSLAVFLFYALVNPEDPDSWFRLGLIAQKNKYYDLALQAFTNTSHLDPSFVGGRIYAAQCYLEAAKPHEAEIEIKEAKHVLETSHDKEKWSKSVADIENLLAAYYSNKEEKV